MRPMRDGAAAREHRLAEHRLARRGVADHGKVTDVGRSIIFHGGIPFSLETVQTATAGPQPSAPFAGKGSLAKAGWRPATMVCMRHLITDHHPAEKQSLAFLHQILPLPVKALRDLDGR